MYQYFAVSLGLANAPHLDYLDDGQCLAVWFEKNKRSEKI